MVKVSNYTRKRIQALTECGLQPVAKSTVHGTKEFAALDAIVIAAIKGKLE